MSETEDLKDRYEANFEIEPDFTTYRVDMQKKAYEMLFTLFRVAQSSVASTEYVSRHMLNTLAYGSTADLARAMNALSKATDSGFENLLKFLGSPDTPSQIAVATSQRKESARSTLFQSFDPLDRERIRQLFMSMYGDLKSTAITVEPIPVTPEPEDNLLLFPELSTEPDE